VGARGRPGENAQAPETKTLGDVLYANKKVPRVPEEDWVALVRSIAGGDQLALHALYARMHRVVFTLIVRIVGNRETAEELTLDVFHDVWRRAPSYDADGGSVVGWIMNQARSRAMQELTPHERLAIETAFFAELTYAEAAARLNEPLGTVKTRIRSGLTKLRQGLAGARGRA
jgi:RNA polymerase sigma-70 factor (ECF subfamily)